MSALASQADSLRTAADQFEKAMRGRFDAINPSDLPPMLREAADTIENLRNRLTERETCQIELDWAYDEYPQARWWRCHGCGERFLYQRGLNPTYCPECGLQRVVE